MNFDVIDTMISTTQKIADVDGMKHDMLQHVSVCVSLVKFEDVATFDISN